MLGIPATTSLSSPIVMAPYFPIASVPNTLDTRSSLLAFATFLAEPTPSSCAILTMSSCGVTPASNKFFCACCLVCIAATFCLVPISVEAFSILLIVSVASFNFAFSSTLLLDASGWFATISKAIALAFVNTAWS